MKKTAKSGVREDLFQYLPSEIILNILSRLDVRTAMRGKCVCKPWLDLLITPEFVKSHLSISLSCLIITERVFIITEEGDINLKSVTHKMVDEFDLKCDWHRLNKVFDLDLPFRMTIRSSINGLIFLENFRDGIVCNPITSDRILCNPITREYIKLTRQPSSKTMLEFYGFGVSRVSGQYKVVGISVERSLQTPLHLYSGEAECQVYTLGTGLWRRIGQCGRLVDLADNSMMAFFCGNLHWWWRSKGVLPPHKFLALILKQSLLVPFPVLVMMVTKKGTYLV